MSQFEKQESRKPSKVRNFLKALGLVAALSGASEAAADEANKPRVTQEVTMDAERVTPRGAEEIQAEAEKREALLKRIGEEFPQTLKSLENITRELNQNDSKLDEAIAALEKAIKNKDAEELARLKNENPRLWEGVEKVAQISLNSDGSDTIPGKDGR